MKDTIYYDMVFAGARTSEKGRQQLFSNFAKHAQTCCRPRPRTRGVWMATPQSARVVEVGEQDAHAAYAASSSAAAGTMALPLTCQESLNEPTDSIHNVTWDWARRVIAPV